MKKAGTEIDLCPNDDAIGTDVSIARVSLGAFGMLISSSSSWSDRAGP